MHSFGIVMLEIHENLFEGVNLKENIGTNVQ